MITLGQKKKRTRRRRRSLAFNALGYLFSSFSKSIEAYMGMANFASFLMMFISGVFFPTATMPDWLRPVTEVIPLTYFVNGLRDGLVYGSGIATGEFWLGIGVMALWELRRSPSARCCTNG